MKTMMHIRVSAVAAVMAAGLAISAQAAVLYDNIPGFPNATPPVNGYCSPCFGQFQVYEPFTLAGASTVTHTDFAVTDGFGSGQTIQISVWNAALNTQIFSQTFASGGYTVNNGPAMNFGYDVLGADLTGLSLDGGTYYISYFATVDPEGLGLAIPGWDAGQQSLVQSFGAQDTDPGADLNPSTADFSNFGGFDLIGDRTETAVPEPASLALFGMALAGLGFVRRRKA